MTKKILIVVIMIIAFIALLQGNVFAAETLPEAVNDVITLTEDVVLTETAVIDGTVTLNLNGHTIKNENDIWEVNGPDDLALINVVNDGNLTINGEGTLAAKENDCYAICVYDGGNLTINGGKYVGNCSAVYIMSEGTVTVNGGEFSIQQLATSGNEYQETLNCKDSYYIAGTAEFIVKGGKYYKYDPSDAAEPNAPQSYVAEGYKVVAEGDYYEVICAHTKGELVSEIPATYKTTGVKSHWICGDCSKIFTDLTQATEVTDEETLLIPVLAEVTNNNANVTTNAFDEAINESVDSNSSTVVIPVLETEETITSVTVPVSSLTDVVDADKELLIETSEVVVTLDTKAIEKVVEQAGTATDIKIEVTKVEDTVLNEEQKESIKDQEVACILSAEIIASGKTISDFGGGKVKIEIPFTPEEGAKESDYKVIYIADDGTVTDIATKYIDGALIVELEHFSEYAIVKVATIKDDLKDDDETDEPSVNTPEDNEEDEADNSTTVKPEETTDIVQTGDNIALYISILGISVIGVAIVAKRKFNKK